MLIYSRNFKRLSVRSCVSLHSSSLWTAWCMWTSAIGGNPVVLRYTRTWASTDIYFEAAKCQRSRTEPESLRQQLMGCGLAEYYATLQRGTVDCSFRHPHLTPKWISKPRLISRQVLIINIPTPLARHLAMSLALKHRLLINNVDQKWHYWYTLQQREVYDRMNSSRQLQEAVKYRAVLLTEVSVSVERTTIRLIR